MKQFIKSFAMLLFAAVGLASCNETVESDTKNVTYPEHMQLGTWESEHALLNSSYVAELALNLKGDTVLNIVKIDAETNFHNYMSSTECEYDPKTGMVSAYFENSFLTTPALVYLALRKDRTNTTVQMFETDGENKTLVERFIANSADNSVLYQSSWKTADVENADPHSIILFNSDLLNDKDDRVDFTLGAEYYVGTYNWNPATRQGTVTVVSEEATGTGALVGQTLTLSTNEKNQLVMQAGNETLVYERSH